jgi:hypothetical protein
MAKAVITKTTNGVALRIKANMGSIPGLPCGDSTIIVHGVDNYMDDNVSVFTIFGKKIELTVGEVEDVGGDTDLDSTMKIRNAIVTLLGW